MCDRISGQPVRRPGIRSAESLRARAAALVETPAESAAASFAGWLAADAFTWDYFITLTWRDARSRSLDFVGARILELCGSPTRPGPTIFLCAEFGSWSGRIHHHALLSCKHGELDRLDLEWRVRYGFTHCRKYDASRGAAGYVADYITKDDTGFGKWNFYDRIWDSDDAESWTAARDRSGWQAYTDYRWEAAIREAEARKGFQAKA